MKYWLNLCCKTSLLFVLLLTSQKVHSQEYTEGSLTFKVQTSSYNGNYSPKHVLSIWIEDASGFVKTAKLMGNKRKEYLYTWNQRSSGNTVDAVTGSTLSSHQSHTITWDGSDKNGNTVPDGDYKVRVEFAEQHAQGPLYSLTFTKGVDAVSLTPSNEGNFKNISLLWVPAGFEVPEAAYTYAVEGLTVTFTNSSTNADSYSWDFGDSESSVETDPVHTYTAAGTYTVVLGATAGALTVTSEQDVTVSASTEDVADKKSSPRVYPIPADRQLIVEFGQTTAVTSYEILSIEGRQLKNAPISETARVIIGLEDLQSGSYILRLKGPEEEFLFHFLKE